MFDLLALSGIMNPVKATDLLNLHEQYNDTVNLSKHISRFSP